MYGSLDADHSIEENCVRLIQAFLQIERLFSVQIVRQSGFTQLTVTLHRTTGGLVESDVCDQCDIRQLCAQMQAFAQRLITQDVGEEPPVLAEAPPPPRLAHGDSYITDTESKAGSARKNTVAPKLPFYGDLADSRAYVVFSF